MIVFNDSVAEALRSSRLSNAVVFDSACEPWWPRVVSSVATSDR